LIEEESKLAVFEDRFYEQRRIAENLQVVTLKIAKKLLFF